MKLAVVGAHLTGLPLNKQLIERNAKLLQTTRTKPTYQFFALPNTTPPKPGLIKTITAQPIGIEVEVWDLAPEHFATFVELVPPPLCIGTLDLESGEQVKGFLVEPYAAIGAKDITHFGGWRAYLKSLDSKA